MLILSPQCFVSCLELLASPSQSTLAGLSFCQRMFAASRCLCGLILLPRVSTLPSAERRLGWDRWHAVAELSVLISSRPKWLSVCTGWCRVLGHLGDALGCDSLFEQISFLPSTPLLTYRQALLSSIWQQSSLFWARSSFMGSHTGRQYLSQLVWVHSGCSGPHPAWLVSLRGSPATRKHVAERWRRKMSCSLSEREGCKFCLDNKNIPSH